MTQITLKPIRQLTTVTLEATLTDNGVKISWLDLENVKAYIYSEDQRIVTGPCTVEVDGEDDTVLICRYGADKPQFLGIQKLVITCDFEGQHNTYDKKAFKFVESTDQTVNDGTTIAEESVEVDIDVEDVDSSILAGAIQAALDAAEFATEKGQYADEKGDYAKDQGDYAKDQGDYAKDQGDYAKDQGDYAKNKGDYAKQKGDYALEQGGIAVDAAALANQKAGLANDAATLANQKAGLANDAAALANQKAGLADDAATLANTKAGLANDAATLANQKAGYANDQGDYAKNQGDYAKQQGDAFAAIIADNLTTDDPTKALSAKQGKVLDGKISQLGQQVKTKVSQDGGIDTKADLSFVDEESNCIAQFKDGHIKTKKFDSRDIATLEDIDRLGIQSDNAEDDNEELAFVDEDSNCIAQFKGGHLKTKYFDSRNIRGKSFRSIGIDRLTIGGISTKNADGSINLLPGDANKCYIDAQLQCWHYTLSAEFRCSSNISFILGKSSTYGGYVKVYKDNNGSYLDIYSGTHLGHHGVLDFELNSNEDYLIRIQNDVDNTGKTWIVELIGNLNEYYTATYVDGSYAMHAYGAPYVSTESGATVKSFDFSIQRWYDTKEIRCSIFGHSYIEADSLGSDRDKCFANLLAEYIGERKMVNFGLGGLELEGLRKILGFALQFAKAGEYCIIWIGGNDARKSGVTPSYMIGKLQDCIQLIEDAKLIPILCTEGSGQADGVLSNTLDYNDWIRSSGYLYCDTAQVFFDVDITTTTPTDANIRTDLFLSDNTHMTVQGHKLLFERFKKDCPYLF